jgi:hypothetical protein
VIPDPDEDLEAAFKRRKLDNRDDSKIDSKVDDEVDPNAPIDDGN